jgi:hypothetical protein
MPITWSVDPTARFVVMSVSDPYTIEEWRTAMLAILEAPISRPRLAILVDRRHSTPATTSFVNQMSAFFEEHQRALLNSLRAILVSDDAGFGMARMTALRNPDATIQTFRSYEQAVAWLTLKLES